MPPVFIAANSSGNPIAKLARQAVATDERETVAFRGGFSEYVTPGELRGGAHRNQQSKHMVRHTRPVENRPTLNTDGVEMLRWCDKPSFPGIVRP
jgi:hypothetical protein